MRLGFHISIAGGLHKCLQEARLRRCSTMQLFTSAPVRWAIQPFTAQESAEFVAHRLAADITPLFIHAPYLLNLASTDGELHDKSRRRLLDDLAAANLWQADGVVVHVGSEPQLPRREAVARVRDTLLEVIERTTGPARIIIENCAGQGAVLGIEPEEIAALIGPCERSRIGVCFDTAHAFAAGFPVHTHSGIREFIDRCDGAFGLDLLRLVHANDTPVALGSQRDRHAHIGARSIGRTGFAAIMENPALQALPFVMETPKGAKTGLEDDLRNLRALRRLIPHKVRPPLPPAPRLPLR